MTEPLPPSPVPVYRFRAGLTVLPRHRREDSHPGANRLGVRPMTHTKEPWSIFEHGRVPVLTSADYARAVSCVNALAGVDDPEAYVSALRRVADAAREFMRDDVARTVGKAITLDHALRSALSALEPSEESEPDDEGPDDYVAGDAILESESAWRERAQGGGA